jgi:hypothetical protein
MTENENVTGTTNQPNDELLQRGGLLHDLADHALDVGLTLGLTGVAGVAKGAINDVIHRPHDEPESPIILPPGVDKEE